jgi:hypothetical protein
VLAERSFLSSSSAIASFKLIHSLPQQALFFPRRSAAPMDFSWRNLSDAAVHKRSKSCRSKLRPHFAVPPALSQMRGEGLRDAKPHLPRAPHVRSAAPRGRAANVSSALRLPLPCTDMTSTVRLSAGCSTDLLTKKLRPTDLQPRNCDQPT